MCEIVVHHDYKNFKGKSFLKLPNDGLIKRNPSVDFQYLEQIVSVIKRHINESIDIEKLDLKNVKKRKRCFIKYSIWLQESQVTQSSRKGTGQIDQFNKVL